MAEKVFKCGVKKETGWLYFVDKKGDVSRAKMVRGGKKKAKKKVKKKATKKVTKKATKKRRRR